MRKTFRLIPGLALLLLAASLTAFGQSAGKKSAADEGRRDPVSSSTFNSLKFRSIGPAFTSGRIADIAVNP
ncbi:MAG: hypothetical protein PHV14_08115, partial [Bacteroidales bacterium]|nr:hypothetical protein [Bacteroidales bacterium]